ncbi:G-protein coupled receptor 151 protein-like [Tiliqua scincoides]|uniref:G-protein coupled receptor 151 protein-like n=1 Tax=Tiliqua scincoides TaxID=71010 RepID=UPI0034620680
MNSSQAGAAAEPPAALSAVLALSGLGAAGAAGNLLLAAALGRAGGAPAPLRALLLSLSAADLLLALLCLPPRLAARAQRSWRSGPLLCRTTAWLLQGCPLAKGLGWAAVGGALAAAPGRGGGWGWGRAHLAAVLGAVWGAALLLPLPLLLFARLAPPGPRCALRAPPSAARFLRLFGLLYPPLACLAPAALAAAAFRGALRAPRGRAPRPDAPPALLPALAALCHAAALPHCALGLWERLGPPPPPALRPLADALLLLDGALRPAALLAASRHCRRGLRAVCGAAAPQQAPPDPRGAEAEKVPPDVQDFWRERRRAAAGEDSDPVPWERPGC